MPNYNNLITHVPLAGTITESQQTLAQGGDIYYDIDMPIPKDEINRLLAQIAAGEIGRNSEKDVLDRSIEETIKTLEAENSQEANNVLSLIQELPPCNAIETGGQKFLASDQVSIRGRLHCVMYVQDENRRSAARLFYKSTSEGEWRSAPQTGDGQTGNDNYLSKGDAFEGGYVRETRPSDDIREFLTKQEQYAQTWTVEQGKWLYERFTAQSLGNRNIYTQIADQTRLNSLPKEVFRFKPGMGFETGPTEKLASEQLREIVIEGIDQPNFTKVLRVIESNHLLLGKVTTEVIPSQWENLEWHFSYDSEGRVWMSGITGVNERLNSYGTSEEVILDGVLGSKPIEYRDQIKGLRDGIDFESLARTKAYVDITRLLDNLPIIQQFRRARGIYRKPPSS